ncbi:hypothetical protein AWM70_08570 [Paenibacillus yonginensis]|uniref:Uncharacterized protein n=1 Tax=Paenibacillus yonginensis TaxID=1462996 RepID=A0A1B1MZN2_9BACL|nr:hypothetical protein [Paenibacillus yonginensis]ANS74632.1 hypothetical protein AWM70_08570 [Paenibacillus yonginensis]
MGKFLIYDGDHSFGASEIAAAAAMEAALSGFGTHLLVHLGSKGEGAEQGFLSLGKSDMHQGLMFAGEGMDALFQLAESGRLSSGNIVDYTFPLLKGRLDLAFGHELPVKRTLAGKEQVYRRIWDKAGGRYSRVIVQGSEWMLRQAGIGPGDKQIVVLRQNRGVLQRYYNRVTSNLAADNKELIVLYPYDENSVLSVKNVKRLFGRSLPIIGVPHCTDYVNAWNNGEAAAFMLRNRRTAKKAQPNSSFIMAIRQLTGYLGHPGVPGGLAAAEGMEP